MTNTEVKDLMKVGLRMIRRYGYRVTDEVESLTGFTLCLAMKHYTPDRGATLETYFLWILLRAVTRLDRWRLAQLSEDDVVMYWPRRDDAQRLLMNFPEPDRSVGFEFFIERVPRTVLMERYTLTVAQLTALIERVQDELISLLEDVP